MPHYRTYLDARRAAKIRALQLRVYASSGVPQVQPEFRMSRALNIVQLGAF